MLLKIVSLFLIFILVLAMLGKLRTAGRWLGLKRRAKPIEKPAKCPECGTYLAGGGHCPCQSG